MTLSRCEELELRAALLAQQLVELSPSSPEAVSGLLQQLASAVRDHGLQARPGDAGALATLRRVEIERLMREAAELGTTDPRWRTTLGDLRSELEAQCLVEQFPPGGDDGAAL